MKLSDLAADPENRRTHPSRNVDMLVDSIRAVGTARSIVVDETGRILAGNGVVAAAKAAGVEDVVIVDADGEAIVAVRRSNLTDTQKRQLALYDNRTAELAEWDAARLAADWGQGLDLAPYFTNAELVELEVKPPDFDPVDEATQGRLDQTKQVTCPQCGHEFKP